MADDVDQFFALARVPDVKLEAGDGVIELLKRIAASSESARKFRLQLAGINDADRRSTMRDLIKRVAVSLEDEAAGGENWADLIDRYLGTALAGTAVASGIAVGTASFAAAPFIFVLSIACLAATAARRYTVKRDATADKKASKLVLQLLD